VLVILFLSITGPYGTVIPYWISSGGNFLSPIHYNLRADLSEQHRGTRMLSFSGNYISVVGVKELAEIVLMR